MGALAVLLGLAAIVLGARSVFSSTRGASPRARLDSRVKERTLAWRETVERESRGLPNVSVPLVLAVIARESSGNENVARGGAGEVGLMQVTQGALTDYLRATNDGEITDLESLEAPALGIRVGTWYLNEKIDDMGSRFHGLRAYNAGTVGARNNPLRGAEYARWVTEVALPEFENVT